MALKSTKTISSGGKIEVQKISMLFFNMYGVLKSGMALAIVRVRWYS
jgi:hypothetical protein